MKRVSWILVLLLCSPVTILRAQSVAETFKQVRDSVVVIGTTQTEPASTPGAQPTAVGGLGSGVLIDRLGVVLTAAHVVQVAEQIEVQFTSGETIPARVEGSVPAADVAVLRLERAPTDAVSAKLGDSDRAEVGDQIFIVGAPLGISHTLTVGHVSARRTTESLFGGLIQAEMLQTDAAINVGNSGGPMFNMSGEVIGIVSHMISQTGSYEGLGFAMTSNLARQLLLQDRSVWSGFEGLQLSGPLAAIFNVPQESAILVQRVAAGSPASRMGLRPGFLKAEIEGETVLLGGDILLGVEGISLADPDAAEKIQRLLRTLAPGEDVSVTVLRGSQRVELSAVLIPD